ncbi:MAG: hypothetical protein ABSB80_00135 [Methanoregula sp.]|uniref:hypothetical protein n=1 Tax=Methanoregula sp. TaxID=2052170 RepID=UPI003D128685
MDIADESVEIKKNYGGDPCMPLIFADRNYPVRPSSLPMLGLGTPPGNPSMNAIYLV